ncbi:D-isomer specific 2-hydroxyacid dehydrogenase, NAD binding domain-containing protein [Cladophialophora immunda]|nr:D-isomer specific 2-hydroxyacid dehydrogenase, NAD binding domain-containing protein [Cladophialophora immunda]
MYKLTGTYLCTVEAPFKRGNINVFAWEPYPVQMAAKKRVLSLGHVPVHNAETVAQFYDTFDVISTTKEERERSAFLEGLRTRKWGEFDAILRCFWYEGDEMEPFDSELVPLLPSSLQIHSSCGAGYDWMDIPAYTERGFLYCNGASAPAEAVADLALYLVLSVFRHLTEAQLAARSGSTEAWQRARAVSAKAQNPEGKTLGIIGLGRIGYLLAKKAHHGLDMNIQYHDVRRRTQEDETAVQATYIDTLEGLVQTSDCVVCCVPFEGHKLFDATMFSRFKKGSRFVNVARGSLHDEAALVAALKSGHLAAAGLDVQEQEPEVHPELIKMGNVTLTPHIGGTTVESGIAFEKLAMDNITAFFQTGKALTPVNGTVGT